MTRLAFKHLIRTHSSLGGNTPTKFAGRTLNLQTTLNNFCWKTHCRGLYQLPAVAWLSIRHAHGCPAFLSKYQLPAV